MHPKFTEDAPLPYPRVKHQTRWPGVPISEEYLIPPEDRQALLEQLYPFVEIPSLDETLLDIHENKEFVVRESKVVREDGMNMLVSPYYYRSGGSVIDWMSLDNAADDHAVDEDLFEDDEDDDDDDFGGEDDGATGVAITGSFMLGSMSAQRVKPGKEARLTGLIERQHEGPGL